MASEKVTALLEEIKAMSVLELSELVHAVEEEFGVSAAAAVAVAAPAEGGAAAAEEKTEFDVVLAEVGSEKIKVIKAVREITGLGPRRSESPRRRCTQDRQGSYAEGRSRSCQSEARRSRRQGRTQIKTVLPLCTPSSDGVFFTLCSVAGVCMEIVRYSQIAGDIL